MTSKKIVCAMSGGVDSAVSAALLKKAGFDVVGVFMKFWSEGGDDSGSQNRCCSLDSEVRARRVARILNIPFYVFDFKKEFKKRIVDQFLLESKSGDTPNPCVTCNKEIKFGLLLEKALELGIDSIATGHYCRIINKKEKIELLKGKDENKDQSYFLWRISPGQLRHVIFPVGDYTRQEVEKLAKRFKLPFDNVKKSMEVCFIPGSTQDFLAKHLKVKSGKMLERVGKKLKEIGEHEGLSLYTIGQRKGLGLPGGPFYVSDKDVKKNILIVTRDEKDLFKKEFCIKEINFPSGFKLKRIENAKVKIRYRDKGSLAKILISRKRGKIIFNRPQRAITPGQSAVVYRGEKLLMGGIIC